MDLMDESDGKETNIPGSAAGPLNQGKSLTCTCHALANAIADQLNDEYQIDIDQTRLANVLVNNNQHVGAVWPDEYNNYSHPILAMDEKTKIWYSIKIKTVKRVEKFINAERHVLSYYTTKVGNSWTDRHCVFVRQQLGDLYDCVNSWGDYNLYPAIPVKKPGNILWVVQVECKFAPNCKDAVDSEKRWHLQNFEKRDEESVQHQGVRGYHTFAHIKDADKVFEKINIINKELTNRMVRVKMPTYEDEKTLFELKENLCEDYFKRYFEKQAKEKPVVLPQVIPSNINKVVDTMESWCNDANEFSGLKGVVIHSFDVSMYFDKCFYDKFNKERLCKDLDMKYIPSTPIIIVYNPKENVILLIRKSEKKSLKKEIELCSSDVKMFMMLYGDQLKRSNVKVVSLLARNLEVDEFINCKDCEHSIVPVEILESYELFKVWWDSQINHYKVKNTDEPDQDKVESFSAKFIGLVAAAQFFDKLPTFTKDPTEQMDHALLILTPEQKDILYSGEKHLIIKGPYGCGKTIVARKKLQMLSEGFTENGINEMVYFICYDPRSALANEIVSSPNVKVHCNKKGERLSKIIRDINKEVKNENVNLIVDEYDSEDLDEREAKTLNGIFEEKFRDSFVFLIPQSMEKNREVNKEEKTEREEKNMFHLLQTMKQVELNLVMRNPIEISNLIWVTQNFLKEEQTIYQHQKEKRSSENLTVVSQKSMDKNASGYKLPTTGISTLAMQSDEFGNKIDSEVTSQKQRSVMKIGLDEAFALAKIPRGSNTDRNKIVNSFTYIPSEDTGHYINTCNPKLFEVVDDNTPSCFFEKLLALNFVLRKLNIVKSNSNNKHVILHFNTKTEKIPTIFVSAFECLGLSSKVTGNYQDFKYNMRKSILVCNFCSFRGLEHSNITITIEHDIYSVQHYLVEAMARCTNKLALVVLQRSETVSRIIEKWKDGLQGKSIIDWWKIQISAGKKRKVSYQEDQNLKLITINCCSREHEAMRRKFDQLKIENHDFNFEQTAEELIQKWAETFDQNEIKKEIDTPEKVKQTRHFRKASHQQTLEQ